MKKRKSFLSDYPKVQLNNPVSNFNERLEYVMQKKRDQERQKVLSYYADSVKWAHVREKKEMSRLENLKMMKQQERCLMLTKVAHFLLVVKRAYSA